MMKVGLTGGLACGKSFVGELLKSMGCLLIQADELGHQVLEPGGAAYDAVVSEFGRDILTDDGHIDRRLLAERVFGRPDRLERLNSLYLQEPKLFSPEDARWLNVLRGYLGLRLAAHQPRVAHEPRPKRKGDALDHCWRCETVVDERFTEVCPDCDSKAYHWRVCPVCRACGCQRSGRLLV